MEIDKVFSSDVDGVADNLFSAVKNSVSEIKAMQQRKAAENVQLVIQALKKIESDLQDKFDGVTTVIEKRVATIKDGRDGLDGRNGRDGKDGRPGRDGAPGARGPAGVPGTNGRDGEDGVSVTDARIDFDGSLIISLSSGREINVGEVVAPDLAEKIKVITNGGGTSQSVLDSLASLQAQITALSNLGAVNYVGTWDASTNTPTIVNGTGDKGDYYVVSVAGSTNIDGQTLWGVGDWIIFNGVVWQRVDGGSTGNFTDLSASGVVTLSGGTANGLAYLNGSKVLTTGSTLTFDGSRQIRLNFGGYTDWYTGYNTILVGASTLAGAFNSSISHLASNLTDDTGAGGWRYVLSGSRASVLTQSNGTLTWSATTTTGNGGASAASFLKPIISANFAGAITLNSSSDPGSLTHYGTATISGAVTLSAGTANGVAYLNGSKVLTTGSALTFDGTNFGTTGTSTGSRLIASSTSTSVIHVDTSASSYGKVGNSISMGWEAGTQHIFNISAAEGMRLTSTGLGIGTSSPAGKLHVAGQTRIQDSANAANYILIGSGANAPRGGNSVMAQTSSMVMGTEGAAPLIFITNATEGMRLDSSGNLGLGVTPSASSASGVLFLKNNGQIAFSGPISYFDTNIVYNSGADRYIANGTASRIAQLGGSFQFLTAPSGTAGNAISFTQAMTLDASGNLGVGQTNPSAWLVNGIGIGSGASDWGATIYTGTASSGYLCFADGASSTDRYRGYLQYNHANDAMVFATAATERARIDSSGNFVVTRATGGDTTVGSTLYADGTITTARASSNNGDLNLYVYSTGAAAARFYVGMGGTVYATSTTITAISDQRLKENIQDIDVGLSAIMALKPRKFDWKSGKGKDKKGDRGWIAQEFEQVFPDMVDTWADPAPEGEEPYKAVNADLIPVLVKAIQELKAEFDAYKATHP